MGVHFSTNPTGMFQNGGSSGAAALQQEMNSDIRAMDLGAPTASWEIMALWRETTHVTSWKRNPFTVFQNKAQVYPYIIHVSFLLRLKFPRWFITDNIWPQHKCCLHNTKIQSSRVRSSWHSPDWQTSQLHSFIPGRVTPRETAVKNYIALELAKALECFYHP